MKSSKIVLIIAFVSVLFVGCKEKTNETDPIGDVETEMPKVKREITAANVQTANFNIKGMTCAIGCAKTIEKELNSLDGVKDATVDFDKKSATISYDKTILNPQSITKVVQATGDGKTYVVSNFK